MSKISLSALRKRRVFPILEQVLEEIEPGLVHYNDPAIDDQWVADEVSKTHQHLTVDRNIVAQIRLSAWGKLGKPMTPEEKIESLEAKILELLRENVKLQKQVTELTYPDPAPTQKQLFGDNNDGKDSSK